MADPHAKRWFCNGRDAGIRIANHSQAPYSRYAFFTKP